MNFYDELAVAIKARIQGISVANGYRTDIGLRVFDGRRRLDEGSLPCAVIVEEDDEPAGQQRANAKVVARFAVEGVASCDPDNPNVVGRDIVADIKRALWSGDLTFGNRAIAFEYGGRTIAPREDGLDQVSAAVTFSVTFAESLAAG